MRGSKMPNSGGAISISVRQRYSASGYSSGDDETLPSPLMVEEPPSRPSWKQRFEILVWVVSVIFIFYFGDMESNFFTLLLKDHRIKRTALNLGILCVIGNIGFCYFLRFKSYEAGRVDNKWELLSSAVLPLATVLGLLAFLLFSLALWPIWKYLTLPLLITLFMAFVVVCPYILSYRKRNSDEEMLRVD